MQNVIVPEDLMFLQPSEELPHISMSSLARKGTELLRTQVDKMQPVSVKVQGAGSMVTISQRQYDEIVALIQSLRKPEDGMSKYLSDRFDALVAGMRDGAGERAHDTLFSTTDDGLNKAYRLGDTETYS